VMAVFSKPLGLLEFFLPVLALVKAVVFLFFVLLCLYWCKQRTSSSGSWRKAGVGGLLMEMLFKARSINLGWFFFDKNLHDAVFDPLRSRWSPGETV
jgi:hypothetical protein